MFSFYPKTIVITGTTTGLGKALLEIFLQRNHRVISISRNLKRVALYQKKHPNNFVSLDADLSDPKSVLKIKSDLNRYAIDVFIHNAGYGEIGPLELVSLDKIRAEFEVNVFSSLALSKMVIPIMREGKGGLIIHIGSSAGFISTPFNGAYAASKHALEAINDALRVELRAFNIRVVLFQAGKLKTSYQQKIIKLAGQYLKLKNPYKN